MKHKQDAHPHLRSYVGQARVSLHSAKRQLELAQTAFQSHPPRVPQEQWVADDLDKLIAKLNPLLDSVTAMHRLVVEHT